MSNEPRIVLVDSGHLPHIYQMAQPLSAEVKVGNEVMKVNTTLPNYLIKGIFSKTERGSHRVGVFLEGGSKFRKEYFANQRTKGKKQPVEAEPTDGYKIKRSHNSKIFESMNLCISLMNESGMSLYRMQDWEADDLLMNMVRKIKEGDPEKGIAPDTTTPIDIFTNDSDMLPLVDEQVSVFYRGSRTYHEAGVKEHTKYFQVTPRSWDTFMGYFGGFGGAAIPYNAALLYKLVKGDSSDGVVGAVDSFGAKGFDKLFALLRQAGVDVENTFRYFKNFDTDIAPALAQLYDSEDKLIAKTVTPETVEYMKYIYYGIHPCDMDYKGMKPVSRIDIGVLSQNLKKYQINLV